MVAIIVTQIINHIDNSQAMKVQFVNEKGRNPFKNAIVATALNERKMVIMSQCFSSIVIDEWRDFLHIVWKACAECSRDHRGQWCVERTPVTVALDDGRTFSTYIWYDVEAKSLRYVSLY